MCAFERMELGASGPSREAREASLSFVICHLPFASLHFAFCICHLGAGEKVNKGSEGEQKSTCEGNLLKVMYHVVHSMGEKGRINKYNTGGEESKTK